MKSPQTAIGEAGLGLRFGSWVQLQSESHRVIRWPRIIAEESPNSKES